ncbi:hypothetical protein [Candidatus Poriferisodalis sp.]|uniref:hypothetical protein n=1 Tax=Candidatus Poriferisodalis sp. TaxID=3101277 RepID=UPI003B01E3E1
MPRSNDKGSITTPRPCTSTADTGAPASTGQPPLRASPIWCGPPKRKPGHDGPAEPAPAPLGLRWRVERTNSWLSNYGQLRRNTDRNPEHRLAQLALAVALIIAIKLIDHRNRWQPHNRPIR